MDRGAERARASSISRSGSLGQRKPYRKISLARNGSHHSAVRHSHETAALRASKSTLAFAAESQSDESSAYSLSLENVPQRSSSRRRLEIQGKSAPHSDKGDATVPFDTNPILLRPRIENHLKKPSQISSSSPIEQSQCELGWSTVGLNRQCSTKTFIRSSHPNMDILEFPTHRHPRLTAELQTGAAFFVGGGSITGQVRVKVHDHERSRHKSGLAIGRISIDLLGIEEISKNRRSIFINLATELIHRNNPPPHKMVVSLKQVSPLDQFWILAPSVSNIPFNLGLPSNPGPPPFQSKYAKIRYLLAVTLLIREQGKQYLVRSSREITVLPVFDGEPPSTEGI